MKYLSFLKKFFVSLGLVSLFLYSQGISGEVVQTDELRTLCKDAQKLEQDIDNLHKELDIILKKETTSVPVIKNIYEVLTRCFTILFNIQRFSKILILIQQDNKNDFVRCSIVIKNFADYFKQVSSRLDKEGSKVLELKKQKKSVNKELGSKKDQYEKTSKKIEKIIKELSKNREENIIQNDVVYHLASKSESLEELDAELEAENTIGVLKNTKVSTELEIAYPVYGRIIEEFGDKGIDGEMIYNLAFETMPGAIVTSPAKGLVVFSGRFLNYGNMVILSNGEYRIFLYGIDSTFASTGDVLSIGDYVGKMQESSEDKPVIKMELKKSGEPLDPRHWLQETLEKGK